MFPILQESSFRQRLIGDLHICAFQLIIVEAVLFCYALDFWLAFAEICIIHLILMEQNRLQKFSWTPRFMIFLIYLCIRRHCKWRFFSPPFEEVLGWLFPLEASSVIWGLIAHLSKIGLLLSGTGPGIVGWGHLQTVIHVFWNLKYRYTFSSTPLSKRYLAHNLPPGLVKISSVQQKKMNI